MTSRFFGVRLIVAVAAVVAACKSDPTSGLVGNAATLNFEFKTERVTAADSVSTFAVVRDQGGNPIDVPITVTACAPTIATATASSGAPLIQTNVKIKGVSYGTACVVAKSGGLTDTMQVATLPDKIKITSGADTVLSGDTVPYTYAYLDKSGNPMAGVPAPTWSVSASAFGDFPDGSTPSYVAVAPGINTLTASVSLSLLAGTITATYSTNKVVATIPGAFTGTFTPSTGALPGTGVLAEGSFLSGWDNTSTLNVNGLSSFLVSQANDSVRFIMPPTGVSGNVTVTFTGVTASELAQAATTGADTAGTKYAGPFYPGDMDPSTDSAVALPFVSADTLILYNVNYGTCSGGSATSPGDHCDSFFQLVNNTVIPDTVKVEMTYLPTFKQTSTDMDILFCDSTCSSFVGNFDGATTADPEKTTVVIPALTKWNLWINLFDPASQPAVLFRVRITHP